MKHEDIKAFFSSQLLEWDECEKRYADLAEAQSRKVIVDGREYTLTFNPARMRSATAKVVGGKVERPCFLCRKNRPAAQRDIPLTPNAIKFPSPSGRGGRGEASNTYHLCVNPFPILPEHFTIINSEHARQEMNIDRLRDMAYVAHEMEGYLVFFNGACSGASAPDHFHFQAVPKNLVPLTSWNENTWKVVGVQKCDADNLKIDFGKSDFCNILCWEVDGELYWWVVNRRCHRPWQYEAVGDEKILISPASLEFAGVVPLAREEDFHKMTSEMLDDIYNQCWNREPLVDVGIGLAEGITRHDNEDGTTTLENVRIGIGFHWDQRRTFRYEGCIFKKTLPLGEAGKGADWLINRLPVEAYLRSVISSEMSATSSLQLLKAHAVISRSWLMFGSAPHTHFNVCSDDCCQRYQGISDKMNPVVEQAIEETRGEILMFEGDICDARYSKCCGGVTEEFRYCWENKDYPYLRSIRDARPDGTIFCDTENAKVLSQVLNDYDQQTRDFFHWKVEYTQQELSHLVERKLHKGLGLITDLIPLERGKSGRISQLKIVGENGETVIGKELAIRKALSETCLYSSNFVVEKTPSPFGEGRGEALVALSGTGWGHGVGLCQIGAAVMGAEGYSYDEILRHYYPGAEIKKIW